MVAVLYYFGSTIFHACLIIIRVRLWNIFHYHCLVKTIKRVKALYNFENPFLGPVSLLLNCAAIKRHWFGHKCICKNVKPAVQL